MNLGQIRTAVRDWIGEDTAGWFTDAMLNRQINFSMNELYADAVEASENFFVKESNISLVVGQELYALPADFYKLILVERVDSVVPVAVKPIDITQRSRYLYSSVNPSSLMTGETRHYLEAGSIGLVPLPTTAIANAILLHYVPSPTDLAADGNSPVADWPPIHHEVIAWGAVMRCTVRDKELYAKYQPTFDRLKAAFINAVQKRSTQEPRNIVDTDFE